MSDMRERAIARLDEWLREVNDPRDDLERRLWDLHSIAQDTADIHSELEDCSHCDRCENCITEIGYLSTSARQLSTLADELLDHPALFSEAS